jgi:hypothetical protein
VKGSNEVESRSSNAIANQPAQLQSKGDALSPPSKARSGVSASSVTQGVVQKQIDLNAGGLGLRVGFYRFGELLKEPTFSILQELIEKYNTEKKTETRQAIIKECDKWLESKSSSSKKDGDEIKRTSIESTKQTLEDEIKKEKQIDLNAGRLVLKGELSFGSKFIGLFDSETSFSKLQKLVEKYNSEKKIETAQSIIKECDNWLESKSRSSNKDGDKIKRTSIESIKQTLVDEIKKEAIDQVLGDDITKKTEDGDSIDKVTAITDNATADKKAEKTERLNKSDQTYSKFKSSPNEGTERENPIALLAEMGEQASEMGAEATTIQETLDEGDSDSDLVKTISYEDSTMAIEQDAGQDTTNSVEYSTITIEEDVEQNTTNSGGAPTNAVDADAGKNMGYLSDSFGALGIINFAKACNDFSDPEKDGWEKAAVAMELFKSGAKTGEAAVKTTENIKTKNAEGYAKTADGELMGTIGSGFEAGVPIFSGLKSCFELVRTAVEGIKEHEDNSSGDKFVIVVDVASKSLETAKSAMSTAKSVIEAIEGASAGGLMSIIPGSGLDIAISGVKIIKKGYNYVVANAQAKKMGEAEQKIANTLNLTKETAEKVSEDFRKKDAVISNKEKALEETEKELKIENIKEPKKGYFFGIGSYTAKDKKEELLKLNNRKANINDDILKQKTDINAGIVIKDKHGLDKNVKKEDITEFSLVKEIKESNKKTVTRQGIHIANEFAKIAGAIATLTGVGALGGAVVIGAATAVDLGLTAVRAAKQDARDRDALKEAKGETGWFDNIGTDTSKSTAAKAYYRKQKTKDLLNMIGGLSTKDPQVKEDLAEVDKVKGYIEAVGINHEKLIKKNPEKAFEMILKSFSDRGD